MTKPVWLLDVDGVVNALEPGWSGPPRRGYASSGGHEYRIRWAPALVARIRALHESGVVDICWCSTWCVDADQIENLLGLPPLQRAWTVDVNGLAASLAKLEAARAVLASGRRLVWTDDLEVPTSGQVYEELTAGGRALLITPVSRRGLQPEHLDLIEAFLHAE